MAKNKSKKNKAETKVEEVAIEARKSWKKLPNESLYQYLSRIIKLIRWWGVLSFIIGVPGAIWGGVQLYEYIKSNCPDEKIVLHNVIIEKIDKVNQTFKPEQFSNDTSIYAGLLSKFQQLSLDYCYLWGTIDQTKPYEEYKDLESKKLVPLVQEEEKRYESLLQNYLNIFKHIQRIGSYEFLTDSTNRTRLSSASLIDLTEAMKKWHNEDSIISKELNHNLEISIENVYNDSKFKDAFKKSISCLDKKRNSIIRLRLDNMLLDYLIDCNNLYKISYRHYSNIPAYRDFLSSHKVSQETIEAIIESLIKENVN